ncbi:MmgE/PrpD family protein [Mycolicibacterium wolinskyi]|nr:MmgE/PrpD family protein [Mycolicibacterium wolinskyi]MCV7293435.1 MmgE/PrpD family protein [Mycolicibacterium goodii]
MTEPMEPDTANSLWDAASTVAQSAHPETLERAAGCLAVALTDMLVSSRTPRHRAVASALAAGDGPCTVTGSPRGACLPNAVAANAYLMHARLTDDSFEVAAHPGLTVVPVALAAAEHAADVTGIMPTGQAVLRAVVGGYEIACRLAERLLPQVSSRGWRVTSVIAPLSAAATLALMLDLPSETACDAIALAATTAGGPLAVVSTSGDGWRLQPALAVQAGVSAALAAQAGLRIGADYLAARHGYYELFGAAMPITRQPGAPAVHAVTFKRYPVAMYGQSIFDAFGKLPTLTGQATRSTITVAPFAARYGSQNEASITSISSVPGIALQALREFHPDLDIRLLEDTGQLVVIPDPHIDPLSARIGVELADGTEYTAGGNGDTREWDATDFRVHCIATSGSPELCDAAYRISAENSLDKLLEIWRAG